MRFFKRQAVLLSRGKQRHNCDPPPVLEEHGGKQWKLRCRVEGLLEDQKNL